MWSRKHIAAASLFLAGFVNADLYCSDSGPMNLNGAVGETKDGRFPSFCETRWNKGAVINKLQVWANDNEVRGIKYHYTNGEITETYGNQDGDHHELEWDPSVDLVTELTLWGNGKGSRFGRVLMKFNTGKKLDAGKKKGVDGQDAFEKNVGSGILIAGIGGRDGREIDRLGFRFLKSKVDKVKLTDFKFEETPEELNKKMKGLQFVHLAEHTFHNDRNGTATLDFGQIDKETNTRSITNSETDALSFGSTIEVEGDFIVMKAKATASIGYEYTSTLSNTETYAKEKQVNYAIKADVQPNEYLYCNASSMTGVYDAKYNAKAKILLEDGYEFTFDTKGETEQAMFTSANVYCGGNPDKAAEAGKPPAEYTGDIEHRPYEESEPIWENSKRGVTLTGANTGEKPPYPISAKFHVLK